MKKFQPQQRVIISQHHGWYATRIVREHPTSPGDWFVEHSFENATTRSVSFGPGGSPQCHLWGDCYIESLEDMPTCEACGRDIRDPSDETAWGICAKCQLVATQHIEPDLSEPEHGTPGPRKRS
jgi:hypothetical protein